MSVKSKPGTSSHDSGRQGLIMAFRVARRRPPRPTLVEAERSSAPMLAGA